jgi:hypothetical protein
LDLEYLASKEKLFIFNVTDDMRQNWEAPHYTAYFATDDISKQEFDTMVNSGKIRHFLENHIVSCQKQFKAMREKANKQLQEQKEFKKDILLRLWNEKEFPESYQNIQRFVVKLLGKILKREKIFNKDLDRLWFDYTECPDYNQIADAVMDVLDGTLNIGQCENCKKLFLLTPRGRNQKYCSSYCRRRYFYVNKERKNQAQ